ncbi:MAG: hypothetical protein LBF68_07295 [Christensenellaceae bacterium]|jgi:hypothetical protein|nr:hypothetical protein [Christensenellaceae bacterium]
MNPYFKYNYITVTNQKELDEFLNGTTVNKSDYCVNIQSDEPLVVKSSEVKYFKIYDNSIITFLETPRFAHIYAYDDAIAIIKTDNYNKSTKVSGDDNSTIVNLNNNYKCIDYSLTNNAKLKNESLNTDVPREMYLRVNISTQERLDECVKLYGNYSNAKFCINQSYSETGSELVVNQKINGSFEVRGESRVVFKKPTNSDNDNFDYRFDYRIVTVDFSTAIIETNKCSIIAFRDATIIKRCKDDIAYKYIIGNAKLIDESHLLDTNKHKETSKGRCK